MYTVIVKVKWGPTEKMTWLIFPKKNTMLRTKPLVGPFCSTNAWWNVKDIIVPLTIELNTSNTTPKNITANLFRLDRTSEQSNSIPIKRITVEMG